MATKYPSKIDDSSSLPEVVDLSSIFSAEVYNRLRDAIVAIETELGAKPSATYGSVKNRFDVLENTIGTIQIINLSGDLGGTVNTPKVVGLQGNAIASTTPTTGQVLSWNGNSWSPASLSNGNFIASGDLSGTGSAQIVTGIRGRSISINTPSDGYVLTYQSSSNTWLPAPGASGVNSVQTGANYAKFIDLTAFSNNPSTNQAVFVVGGTLEMDPSKFTAANGTRTIKLRIIAETTGPTMSIQLYNLTTNSVVSNSALTTTSTTSTLLMTADLTSMLSSGSAIYQIQIKMASGGANDRVTLTYAGLRLEWS